MELEIAYQKLKLVDYLEKEGYPCFISVNGTVYADFSKKAGSRGEVGKDFWRDLVLLEGEKLEKILKKVCIED